MKKYLFLLTFIFSAFFCIEFVSSADVTLAGSGNHCFGGGSEKCKDDGIWSWTDTNNNKYFCLDKGKHMDYEATLNIATSDKDKSDSKKFACAVKGLYNNEYKNEYTFPDFIKIINAGSDRDIFSKMQQAIWDASDCTDTSISQYTNQSGSISIVQGATEIYGKYFLINITVNKTNLTGQKYNIELTNAPVGTIVSSSKKPNPSNITESSASKLYIYIPKNVGISNFTLQLKDAQYIKKSGTRYTPIVTIYSLTKVPSHGEDKKIENWQRLGRISYEDKPILTYEYTDSSLLSLGINGCQIRLDNIKENHPNTTTFSAKSELMNLYKDFQTNNGLLNFSSPSCQSVDRNVNYDGYCRINKNYPYDLEKNIINAKDDGRDSKRGGSIVIDANPSLNSQTRFSVNNISKYNDTITDDSGNTFYCNTFFVFSAGYTHGYNYNQFVNSGRFLLEQVDSESSAFFGRLYKDCYIPDGYKSNANWEQHIQNAYNENYYEDYVQYVNFKNVDNANDIQKLKLATKTRFINPYELNNEGVTDWYPLSAVVHASGTNNQGLYRMVSIGKYKLPENYIKKGSGEITSTRCDNCYGPKYGLYSKFTYSGETSYKLDYEINYPNAPQNFEVTYDNSETCDFNLTQQIITTPPSSPNNHKLQLVFRTIETNSSKAFLDKYGNSRNPGSNWAGIPEGESSKTKIQKYLDERNNSYNRTGDGAKYTIELTPSIINKIRDDNKDVPYDEWVSTSNSTFDDWKSAFLRDANIFSRATYTDDRMYLAG